MSNLQTQTVATKFGQLKVFVNKDTGEIVAEKTKIIKVADAPVVSDPEVELVAKVIEDSGMSPDAIEQRSIEIGRRVSKYTVLALRTRTTKKPQNYTMTSIMMACGYLKKWERKQATVPKQVATSA